MDNLELLEFKLNSLEEPYQNIQHFGQDSRNYYFIADGKLFQCDLTTNKIQPIVPDHTFTNIESFDILNFENKILIGDGEVIKIIDIGVEDITETALPRRSTALCFNPTQEIAAIVFTDRTLGTYKFDFITRIFEEGVSCLEATVPDTVVVGAGRLNALFEVSETMSEDELGKVIQEIIVDTKPRISWRQNGEEFVVNYWENDRRLFKVFMLPCTAQYICQDTVGILPSIDWAPQGNRITCVLSTETGPKILVYEKNGQRRNYPPIHCDTQKILGLKWSPCARIIAVHGEKENGTFLNLITNKNYKWYIKQHLIFSNENPLLHFYWNTFESGSLCSLIVVTVKKLIVYTYKFEIHHALNSDTCAVIDGSTLLLTLFDEAIVPIFGTVNCTFDSPINFVRFHPVEKMGAVVESSNKVSIFTYSRVTIQIDKVMQLHIPNPMYVPLNERLFHWINRDIYFIGNIGDADNVMYKLEETEDCICENTPLTGIIGIASSLVEQPSSRVEISSDMIISCNVDNEVSFLYNVKYVPVYFHAFQVGDTVCVIVLTIDRRLYINETCVCGNVTSFFVRMPYILLIDTNNTMFCVRLNEAELQILMQNGITDKRYYSRTVEQGAKIISCSTKTLKVVLEMPRGNLEIIMCYIVTIDYIESLLKDLQWKKAISLIRRQRLDFNLLFDLNPERFLKHVPDIIRDCENTDCLNCVIADIRDENCFSDKYQKWSSEIQKPYPNKKLIICNAILDNLKRVDYVSALDSIMFISVVHLSIRVAYEYLADLIRRTDDAVEPDTVRNCIRTLQKHVPGETMYEAALLTYDLVLVRYLAKEIQMDPQVYEPLLERLTHLEPVECRFQINHMLKRYKEAVVYLLRNPNKTVEEIREYITTHKVATEAFSLCPKVSPFWRDAGQLYAEYISTKGDHYTAGYIYVKIQMYDQAIEQFILASNYSGIVHCIYSGEYSDDQKIKIFKRLAERLKETNNYIGAAIVYDDHLGEYASAVQALLDGRRFLEAASISSKRGVKNLIETMVVPTTIECAKAARNRFIEIKGLFEQYRLRLQTIRNSRIEALTATDIYDPDQNPDSDLLSSIGSTSSRRSAGSTGSRSSSRSKRRQKRKALDLRQGSIYEDIAIIKVLHDLYKEIVGLENEMKEAEEALYMYSNVDIFQMEYFCEEMTGFIDHMVNATTEIWPPCFMENYPSDKPEDKAIFQNIEFLDCAYRTPPDLDRSRKTVHLTAKRPVQFDERDTE